MARPPRTRTGAPGAPVPISRLQIDAQPVSRRLRHPGRSCAVRRSPCSSSSFPPSSSPCSSSSFSPSSSPCWPSSLGPSSSPCSSSSSLSGADRRSGLRVRGCLCRLLRGWRQGRRCVVVVASAPRASPLFGLSSVVVVVGVVSVVGRRGVRWRSCCCQSHPRWPSRRRRRSPAAPRSPRRSRSVSCRVSFVSLDLMSRRPIDACNQDRPSTSAAGQRRPRKR